MMKKLLIVFTLLMACCTINAAERWSAEKANAWYAQLPWMAGCDYIPATAINQIEMWSEATYDRATIEKELGWAQDLGFTTLRVYLSSVVWKNDPVGMKDRMDDFLARCSQRGIRPVFVFFDDCWNEESYYGIQPAPKRGVHNSGWVKDPSVSLRADTAAVYPVLRAYVKDVLKRFKDDKRVLMWDLFNEPGNGTKHNISLDLVKKVFGWAREIYPSQPLTCGVWSTQHEFNKVQLELSDVISYHNYGDTKTHTEAIDTLKTYGRPLVCTEYMARTHGSKFQNIMPLLKQNKVVAINWGFVAGKTNTIFSWEKKMPEVEEPPVWFHDIFRQDGTPFDPEEIELIKKLTGKKK